MVRNLIRDNRVVYGGGSAEIACSLTVEDAADKISTVEQYAVRGFAEALEVIPIALAENSGLNGVAALTETKAAQQLQKSSVLGIDCMETKEPDMRKQGVYETLRG